MSRADMAGRCRMIRRLVRLIEMVHRRQRLPCLDALAEMLACSTRTVRRDLEALRACGLDVEPYRED